MSIAVGRAFRIRNKRSDLYLNVEDFSTKPSERVEQYPLQNVGDENRDSQVWHVFAIDNNLQLIANMRSGLVLNVVSNSTSAYARIEQYGLQTAPSATQTWSIKPEPANGSGYFIIENAISHKFLGASDFSTRKSKPIEQMPLQNSTPNRDAQVWAFEEESSFLFLGTTPIDQVAHGVDRDVSDIGDVSRMTSLLPPTPSMTTEVLVGRMVIPFPLIKDPAFSRQQQSMSCPYYVLSRFGYWQIVYYYEHSGLSKVTETKSISVGLTSGNAEEVEKTTGVSISAEASFGFKGFGSAISSTFSRELKVKTSSSVTQESCKTVTVERKYGTGSELAEAIWYRFDRYEVVRLDGSKVLEWVTCDPTTVINDGYMIEVPSK